MNIVSYNLIKFQDDAKFNNKKMASKLGYPVKQVRKMHNENYQFTDEELQRLCEVMGYTKEELTGEMNERIDLKKKKIYGTDYMFLNYKVNSYKNQIINLVSAIIDILFFVILAIFLFTKQVDITNDYNGFLSVLKVIFIIELLVFPFMFFVFPYLKVYFCRTYDATLKTNLKEDYKKDEACGIILGCLRRSINKSTIPYIFTIFSELVIALYCLFLMIYINKINFGCLFMIILFAISFVISIYSFRYHFSKKGSNVRKE